MARTKQGLAFTRNTNYYRQVTHEFNLPTGHSCPGARICLTLVDRDSGRRIESGSDYVCYAASAERFPSARDSRWANWEAVEQLVASWELIELPARATHVRIHGAGDFYSPRYFDLWVETARANPGIHFWAFTKSPHFWVRHLIKFGPLPDNLVLNASRGGKHDDLIDAHGLKCAEVFHSLDDVPAHMPIDTDDFWAQTPGASFALLENLKNRDQGTDERIKAHNDRITQLPEPEPDWLDAPAVLAAMNDFSWQKVWLPSKPGHWECTCCGVERHWSKMTDVTPLYPKETGQ